MPTRPTSVTGCMSAVAGRDNAQVSDRVGGTQFDNSAAPGSDTGGRRPQPIEAEVSIFNASLPHPEDSSPAARLDATRGEPISRSGEVAQPEPFPRVQGYCSSCGGESLFLGLGGYVTCSRLDCPNPTLTADCLGARRKIVAGAVAR